MVNEYLKCGIAHVRFATLLKRAYIKPLSATLEALLFFLPLFHSLLFLLKVHSRSISLFNCYYFLDDVFMSGCRLLIHISLIHVAFVVRFSQEPQDEIPCNFIPFQPKF